MIFFYFFALILVYLSWKSFRGGVDYLNYFKGELAGLTSDFTPYVTIVAPCRGLDAGLEKNLCALFQQDFPAYEVIFVTEDETDEAVPVIRGLLNRRDVETKRKKENAVNDPFVSSSAPNLLNTASLSFRCENKVSAKLVFAGKTRDSSQKVHNLRQAVLEADENSEVFVFVDSDARPSVGWLKNLTAPLQDEKIGCATGYRWFISKKRNFASEMRSVWNASVASALGDQKKSNFCWGGSTAVRRGTFEKLNIREKWRGSLSDDFTVTRTMKEAGLPVYFVPQALTASVENCSFRELLEFTTRQMKITRVYAPHLWKQSLIGSFLFNLVFIWGILIIVSGSIYELSFWLALCALILVSVFSISKAWLRLKAVKLVLKEYESDLKKQFLTQNTFWIFSPSLFFYNSVCALFSRKITWRGIKYELISPNQTSILS